MKKLLALLLCVLMLLSLAACKSSSDKKDDTSNEGSSALEDILNDNDNAQSNEDQNDDTQSDVDENTSSDKKTVSRGTITGAVYQSDFSGLRFTRPDSWVYSTDEQIAAVMNIGAEYLGEKYEDALENNPSVYDMMVIDPITNTNINISYENLKKSLMPNITEEQYIEALKAQFANVTTLDITFNNDSKLVRLCGNDYLRSSCTTTMNGVTATQVYYLRNIDGYMNLIIVTLVSDYDIADIEAMFG